MGVVAKSINQNEIDIEILGEDGLPIKGELPVEQYSEFEITIGISAVRGKTIEKIEGIRADGNLILLSVLCNPQDANCTLVYNYIELRYDFSGSRRLEIKLKYFAKKLGRVVLTPRIILASGNAISKSININIKKVVIESPIGFPIDVYFNPESIKGIAAGSKISCEIIVRNNDNNNEICFVHLRNVIPVEYFESEPSAEIVSVVCSTHKVEYDSQDGSIYVLEKINPGAKITIRVNLKLKEKAELISWSDQNNRVKIELKPSNIIYRTVALYHINIDTNLVIELDVTPIVEIIFFGISNGTIDLSAVRSKLDNQKATYLEFSLKNVDNINMNKFTLTRFLPANYVISNITVKSSNIKIRHDPPTDYKHFHSLVIDTFSENKIDINLTVELHAGVAAVEPTATYSNGRPVKLNIIGAHNNTIIFKV